MRVEFSRRVECDLDEISAYIAQYSARRAVRFIREIRDELLRVEENPLLYQLRPEYGSAARIAVVGRYVILFRVVEDAVWIERVVFGARDLPAQLGLSGGV
jgi:toxin ParE1/3/4